MKTKLTDMLGIKYPIIQGAMGWVSNTPPLVIAVSKAGGLGIMAGARLSPGELRNNIREIRRHTDKPFGVNLTPTSHQMEEQLEVMVGERVLVFSYGRGSPASLIERAKSAGLIALPTMGAVKHAVQAEKDGADAVIVQGVEAGGHASHVTTMVLVPLVVDRVKIPVIAAGGMGDARGLAAALALGAEGISMGTRFIATQESPVHVRVKQKILEATEEETVITSHVTGIRCRVILNELAKAFLDLPEIADRELLMNAPSKLKRAFEDGDIEQGSIAAGQICGMINDIPTCRELIERIVTGVEEILGRINARLNSSGD